VCCFQNLSQGYPILRFIKRYRYIDENFRKIRKSKKIFKKEKIYAKCIILTNPMHNSGVTSATSLRFDNSVINKLKSKLKQIRKKSINIFKNIYYKTKFS